MGLDTKRTDKTVSCRVNRTACGRSSADCRFETCWKGWIFVGCDCCVLSSSLCDELITHPEESYRLWCVVVCDLEATRMRRPWPTGGCCATGEKKYIYAYIYIYRVSQKKRTKLRESVPYVKLYRYNPKHLYPKLNGYGDNGQRKVWTSSISA